MSLNNQGRPTSPVAANNNAVKTVSGNKALEQATKLILNRNPAPDGCGLAGA